MWYFVSVFTLFNSAISALNFSISEKNISLVTLSTTLFGAATSVAISSSFLVVGVSKGGSPRGR